VGEGRAAELWRGGARVDDRAGIEVALAEGRGVLGDQVLVDERARVQGWPAIGSSSLIDTGNPSSARGCDEPGAYTASAARACSSASSKKRWQSALTVASTASARAITASISSTGDRSRVRKRRSASVAGM